MMCEYYVKYNECCCCGRFETKKIGILEDGYKFMFYIDDIHKDSHTWLALLESSTSCIYNKNNEKVSYKSFWYKIHDAIPHRSQSEHNNNIATDGKFDYFTEV